jgi:hypothetical protein
MFYAFLALDFAVICVLIAIVVRMVRAPRPENRDDARRAKRRSVLYLAGAFSALAIVTASLAIAFVGVTGIRATFAAKNYLRERYGGRDSYSIEVTDHVERSTKPASGTFHFKYRYGELQGVLVAEYVERDGKLVFNFVPNNQ